MLLCGLLFGAAAAGAFKATSSLLSRGNETADTAVSAKASVESPKEKDTFSGITTVSYASASAGASQTLDVSEIAESMMPSMVSITNISVQEVQSYYGFFGGRTEIQEQQSSGTGIIIGENDSELLIVTNNHVVEDSTTLTVCFVDNEACEAVIKGTDPDNDLAVIAVKLSDIKEETASVVKIAVLGDSDALKVGQQVVAIGNALGYGQSVTTGIVSALGRKIDTADAEMIQTDAAINPGNSGGALLNMNGEVVGINSAKFSSTEVEGMGYAISITDALPIIEDLMNRTTREKVPDENASWLGVDGEEITSSISSAYGIPQGIYLTSIDSESPLRELGVSVKSVITHFDGVRVTSIENLENRLQYYAAGETVELTVQVIEGNRYVEKTVEVTLGRAAEHTQGGNYGFGYDPFGRH
ncbi:MAG: trypsin-like peptidase domain-containing protein [Clostridia bacterium]|nr:trypsin-like peptidase domain-containing protein [Clostridia bacterium]